MCGVMCDTGRSIEIEAEFRFQVVRNSGATNNAMESCAGWLGGFRGSLVRSQTWKTPTKNGHKAKPPIEQGLDLLFPRVRRHLGRPHSDQASAHVIDKALPTAGYTTFGRLPHACASLAAGTSPLKRHESAAPTTNWLGDPAGPVTRGEAAATSVSLFHAPKATPFSFSVMRHTALAPSPTLRRPAPG